MSPTEIYSFCVAETLFCSKKCMTLDSPEFWKHSCSRGREKQNLIALFWEVISEVINIFLYASKRCPIHCNPIFQFFLASNLRNKKIYIFVDLCLLHSLYGTSETICWSSILYRSNKLHLAVKKMLHWGKNNYIRTLNMWGLLSP